MPKILYRCYFLKGERVKDVAQIEAEDDAGALLQVDRLLADSSWTAAELWVGKQQVSVISKKSNAA